MTPLARAARLKNVGFCVCVQVCMCLCVCVQVCPCVSVFVCRRVHVSLCLCAGTCVHVSLCLCAGSCVSLYLCAVVQRVSLYLCAGMCVCLCVCVQVRVSLHPMGNFPHVSVFLCGLCVYGEEVCKSCLCVCAHPNLFSLWASLCMCFRVCLYALGGGRMWFANEWCVHVRVCVCVRWYSCASEYKP